MTARSLQAPRRAHRSETCWPISKPRKANWQVMTVPPSSSPWRRCLGKQRWGSVSSLVTLPLTLLLPPSDCLQGMSHEISRSANCCQSVFNLMISGSVCCKPDAPWSRRTVPAEQPPHKNACRESAVMVAESRLKEYIWGILYLENNKPQISF